MLVNPDVRLSIRQPEKNAYQRAFEAMGDRDRTLWEKGKLAIKRQFMPGGLLPRPIFEAKIERDSYINAFEFDIAHYVGSFEKAIHEAYGKPFSKLNPKIRREINDSLAGGSVAILNADLPQKVRLEILKMRHAISRLSAEYAVILGNQIAELQAEGRDEAAYQKAQLLQTILNNLDTYVHRSYRAFDDPDWPKKVPQEVMERAAKYLESRYLEEGEKAGPELQARIARTIKSILEDGTAYDSMESFIKESKLGAKDLSVLKRRKDIAPEIRALLGEYDDIRINFAKTITKMSRLIANQRFLDKFLEIGFDAGFLFTEDTRPLNRSTVRIAAEGSEVYSPLNGLYTFPEINQALIDAMGREQMPDWLRAVVQLNGMVKYGKMVLAPTTAMRNWMSAALFAIANGHFDLRQARRSIQGLREYFTHRGEHEQINYLRRLKELGVIYDTAYAGEMLKLLQESRLDETLFGPDGQLRNLKTLKDMAQKFYQYGDDFWKIVGFENEKAMLMKYRRMSEREAEREAAKRIRDTYPTYSMTGRFINHLRRFPLSGTFFSFPSEIIRTSFNILKYLQKDMREAPAMGIRKVFGFAIAAAGIHAIQALSRALIGVDDDEDEAVRMMAAPWQRNSNLLYTGRDAKGNLQYLDMSFIDPYNYWKRPINAILRNQPIEDALLQSAKEALEPFFGEEILVGALIDIYKNKKDTGGKVFNEHDSPVNQAIDIANHLRKAAQPGIAGNLERMAMAMRGEIMPSGKRYNIYEELWALAGFRVTTFDPKTALYYRAFEFRDAKKDASSILLKAFRDPNKITKARIVSALETSLDAREKAYRDMFKLVKAARDSGINDGEIAEVLNRTGVSKSDVQSILAGVVPPYTLDRNTIRNIYGTAHVIYGGDIADMIVDRVDVIRQALEEYEKRQGSGG